MSHTLQFFAYNLNEQGINKNNNYPLFRFSSKEEAYNFIRFLESEKSHSILEGHFVLNNPHLLPTELRKIHMYKGLKIVSEYYVSDSSSDEEEPHTFFDGCFSIAKNSNILKSVIGQIDNNTLEIYGFKEFVSTL